jgi:DNA polymerase-3 subunit epsilon
MRQIVLDTETTGLDPKAGHRIIEIGGVELIDRRFSGKHLHFYINPGREVEADALKVHGITNEFLHDKPTFKELLVEMMEFLAGAELVIHNAPFDVGFIDHELKLARNRDWKGPLERHCAILDTLVMARKMHPGQRNSLDALCKRYDIDNSNRDLHGALLDAQILANLYLTMTGGQETFSFEQADEGVVRNSILPVTSMQQDADITLKTIEVSADELAAHKDYLRMLEKSSGEIPLWQQLDTSCQD